MVRKMRLVDCWQWRYWHVVVSLFFSFCEFRHSSVTITGRSAASVVLLSFVSSGDSGHISIRCFVYSRYFILIYYVRCCWVKHIYGWLTWIHGYVGKTIEQFRQLYWCQVKHPLVVMTSLVKTETERSMTGSAWLSEYVQGILDSPLTRSHKSSIQVAQNSPHINTVNHLSPRFTFIHGWFVGRHWCVYCAKSQPTPEQCS